MNFGVNSALDRAESLGPVKSKKRLVFAPTKYLDNDTIGYRVFKEVINTIMEAIRKIASVKNNTLVISDLKTINNMTVEVIILPVSENERKFDDVQKNKSSLHGKLVKYDNPFDPAVSPSEWEVNK